MNCILPGVQTVSVLRKLPKCFKIISCAFFLASYVVATKDNEAEDDIVSKASKI